MKLPFTTKDKIKNPQKGFGFAFIDEEDKKLKVKKIDGIIEFTNDQGSDSCKFYECATSTETEGTPEVKAGITVTGVTSPESCNGHYSLEEEFTTYETARWKNDSSNMMIYKCGAVDYWVISEIVQDYPSNAYFLVNCKSTTGLVIPPWEAVNWSGQRWI